MEHSDENSGMNFVKNVWRNGNTAEITKAQKMFKNSYDDDACTLKAISKQYTQLFKHKDLSKKQNKEMLQKIISDLEVLTNEENNANDANDAE